MNTIDAFTGQYRWLSNFWPALVTLDGENYRTVEHAYQAAKTNDINQRRAIREQIMTAHAKRLGRRVSLRSDWEQTKEQVMLDLLRQKFQEPILRTALLNTGTAELIEGNTWGDTYWGVCNGKGRNRLGLLLMQVRSELALASV